MRLFIIFLLQFVPSIFVVSPDGVRLNSTPAILEAPSVYVVTRPNIGDTAYNNCMKIVNASPMSCELQRTSAIKADADGRFQSAIQAIVTGTPVVQAFKQFGVFVVSPGVIITPFGPELPPATPAPTNPFPGE